MRPWSSLCLSLALALPAAAGEPGTVRFGGGVLVATGLGAFSSDTNSHPGFGFQLQAHVPVTARVHSRVAFEWTGYRLNDYNLAARALASVLGADYQETRVVFRTYRLGMDGLFYLERDDRGPFLSLGVGAQRSRVYLEDRAVDGSGNETIATVDSRNEHTGLWLGGGLGWQGEHGNVELRLSRAGYTYTEQRPTATDLPYAVKQGWALHLLLGGRF